MTTLLIATRNAHKVAEIRAMLGESFHYLSLKDVPAAPEVIEDADTFAGNAMKKAFELARWLAGPPARLAQHASRILVLADDSGLEVDALGGQPGVHSARFAARDTGAGGNSPDADNNAKLLRWLQDVPVEKRTARFRCVLALVEMDASFVPAARDHASLFTGVCEGRIDFRARGANGFGYDPLFIPNGHTSSFAELGDAVKNELSHRAQALKQFRAALKT